MRPPLQANTISSLWPFQQRAVDSVFDEYNAGRTRTLNLAATGTGKSRMAANVGRRFADAGGNVLCLSHTKELVLQMANWFHRAGMPTGVEMGAMEARVHFDPAAVSATVQTMQGDRLRSWDPGYFELIIVDEVHHHTKNSAYQAAIDWLRPIYVLGQTATPLRHDKKRLSEVYDSVAHRFSLLDAVKAPPPGPYLCRPLYSLVEMPIDLGQTAKKAYDYSDEHLQARILPYVRDIARAIVRTNEGRPTFVFVAGVMCAQGVATALQSMGVRADWVSGERKDRSAVIDRMNRGDLDVLVNVAVLTEGVDIPRVSCVVVARPTKVLALLVQMLGRATRRHDDSGKEDCLLVDLALATPDHDLLSLPDCFDDDRMDARVIDRAKADVRSRASAGETAIDLTEAIEEAERTVRAQDEWRVKATREGGHDLKVVRFDPITLATEFYRMPRAPRSASAAPATESQVKYLERIGVEGAAGVSKKLASDMIGMDRKRSDQGLCSLRQFKALLRLGVPAKEARGMTRQEASGRLDFAYKGTA